MELWHAKKVKLLKASGCLSLLAFLLKYCTYFHHYWNSFPLILLKMCSHAASFNPLHPATFLPVLPLSKMSLTGNQFLSSLFAPSRSDDDDTESRSSRVTQLCTYFQQKYKHLCRLERAESHQKKCRHTFRKALLQAASREPECTGQLLQELQRAACSRTRSEPYAAPVSKEPVLSVFCTFWEGSWGTVGGRHLGLKYLCILFWLCRSDKLD